MNWNAFFAVMTWCVTGLCGLFGLWTFFDWYANGEPVIKRAIVFIAIAVLGAATIGGMGWAE
jgi:hypothetical protein